MAAASVQHLQCCCRVQFYALPRAVCCCCCCVCVCEREREREKFTEITVEKSAVMCINKNRITNSAKIEHVH